MTIINPNSNLISQDELEERYWLNEIPLPSTPDDIYNIFFLDKMIRVKKAKDYPFGSVCGFTQEQEVLEQFFYPHINEKAVFVDIGACWGQYSLKALAMGAVVYAFEPDPRMTKGLNDNIDLNPGFKERIRLKDVAIGDENMTISLDVLEDVPMVTMDTLSFEYDPTFIKIDVEGMEGAVIAGAVKTLQRYKPKLLIENHGYFGFDRIQSISDYYIDRTRRLTSILNSLGYKFEMGPTYGRVYFTFCT